MAKRGASRVGTNGLWGTPAIPLIGGLACLRFQLAALVPRATAPRPLWPAPASRSARPPAYDAAGRGRGIRRTNGMWGWRGARRDRLKSPYRPDPPAA